MDTNICIRTVLAENNRLYCWAGGGIVLDSDIDSEYQESLDKVAKILPVLEETMQIDDLPQDSMIKATVTVKSQYEVDKPTA
jgi:para-aminobenzoate synthetase component 1